MSSSDITSAIQTVRTNLNNCKYQLRPSDYKTIETSFDVLLDKTSLFIDSFHNFENPFKVEVNNSIDTTSLYCMSGVNNSIYNTPLYCMSGDNYYNVGTVRTIDTSKYNIPLYTCTGGSYGCYYYPPQISQ